MLIAETEPIAPGQNNTKPLVTHMPPLNTIAFTGSDGVSHPNGIPVEFKFQDAAGYTPYKTVLYLSWETELVTGQPTVSWSMV